MLPINFTINLKIINLKHIFQFKIRTKVSTVIKNLMAKRFERDGLMILYF